MDTRVIAIVGPTAVGKSDLAVRLAEAYDGEIVNADSRQVYRYLDIGTAKPGKNETARIPHHLFDILNPDESFSLSDYQSRAFAAIRTILERGKIPFLVGGSGQYVWAVVENWSIPRVPPDAALRQKLENRASGQGKGELFLELQRLDAEGARRIGCHNTRRIIRALEVCYTSGQPFSRLLEKKAPVFDFLIMGLTQDRKKLYAKIDRRVDEMIDSGLISEVENILKIGYDFPLPSLSAIGYRPIGLFLRGELDRVTAINQIKFETHRYVRQQYNWFKLKDVRINWFDVDQEPLIGMSKLVGDFLREKTPKN
jgi:tRNA dimethylallyltransferase